MCLSHAWQCSRHFTNVNLFQVPNNCLMLVLFLIIVLILQTRKQKHRQINECVQGYTVNLKVRKYPVAVGPRDCAFSHYIFKNMLSKTKPKYFSTICNYRHAIATRLCSINKDNLQLALQKQSVPQASQFFATVLFVNQIRYSPREGNAPATKSEWNLSDNPRGSVTQIKVIINMTGVFHLKKMCNLL